MFARKEPSKLEVFDHERVIFHETPASSWDNPGAVERLRTQLGQMMWALLRWDWACLSGHKLESFKECFTDIYIELTFIDRRTDGLYSLLVFLSKCTREFGALGI